MNPYRAYQEQAYAAWLRIDMLLALYDGAIEKLEAALAALARRDARAAAALIVRGRLILAGMVSAVNPEAGDLAAQFLRLYEFVNHSLGAGTAAGVTAALRVLRTLREGLQAIRPEATELERSGQVAPADAGPRLRVTA